MTRLIIPLMMLVLLALACGGSQTGESPDSTSVVPIDKHDDRIVNLEALQLMVISEQDIPASLREELRFGYTARIVAMIFQEGVSTQRQQEILDAHDLVLGYRGSRIVVARTNTDDLDPLIAKLNALAEVDLADKNFLGGEIVDGFPTSDGEGAGMFVWLIVALVGVGFLAVAGFGALQLRTRR